jgi:hypothetical protein
VKDQLLQVFQELKSARTIITLLQEDIVKLNATASSNVTKPSQHSESSALDQANRNCYQYFTMDVRRLINWWFQ